VVLDLEDAVTAGAKAAARSLAVGPHFSEALSAPEGWDLGVFRDRVPGPHVDGVHVGDIFHSSGDLVSSAT
jgi:hypothetical protein